MYHLVCRAVFVTVDDLEEEKKNAQEPIGGVKLLYVACRVAETEHQSQDILKLGTMQQTILTSIIGTLCLGF